MTLLRRYLHGNAQKLLGFPKSDCRALFAKLFKPQEATKGTSLHLADSTNIIFSTASNIKQVVQQTGYQPDEKEEKSVKISAPTW